MVPGTAIDNRFGRRVSKSFMRMFLYRVIHGCSKRTRINTLKYYNIMSTNESV